MEAPFKTGERVHPDQLRTWEYVGLSGKPGRDKHSVRRFKKGDWTLEVHARRIRTHPHGSCPSARLRRMTNTGPKRARA